MSNIRRPRKTNAKPAGLKAKKSVASKPRVAKTHRKRRDEVSAVRKKVTQAWASVPSADVEPPVAAALEPEVRRAMPLFFWARVPFAIMDMWFSPLRREHDRTRA
jgi:hypothetical protein